MEKGQLFVKINFSLSFQKEDGRLSTCNYCKDVIYGEAQRVCISTTMNDIQQVEEKTNILLCQSCYGLIEK